MAKQRTFGVEEVNSMIMELTVGTEREVHGKEADAFRAELQAELEEMEREGIGIDLIEE